MKQFNYSEGNPKQRLTRRKLYFIPVDRWKLLGPNTDKPNARSSHSYRFGFVFSVFVAVPIIAIDLYADSYHRKLNIHFISVYFFSP